MSRSRRHSPVVQLASRTQKEWRREYNRCLRHRNKIRVRQNEEPLGVRDVSDIWTSPSDGWIAYWDYWSERNKEVPWHYFWGTPERQEELEREWAARKERLKWKLFNK